MYFDQMWIGARTERTIRTVHEKNLKSAEDAGMSLEEWHKAMSEKGNQPPKIVYISEKTDEEIAMESARWIGAHFAKQFNVSEKDKDQNN